MAIGTGVLYFICAFTENFFPIYKWDAITRAIFIIGLIGWGGFLAWWVNTD
jgi:hypothetical protein